MAKPDPSEKSGTSFSADHGSVVAAHIDSVVQIYSKPRIRSAYLQQVRLIAPAQELVGREEELAQLAAFCTQQPSEAYIWWQAGAWAGKSALMAWFVLHPPANVDIISFFVTARFYGQGDRRAFTDVILQQLAAYLGDDLPSFLPPATREAYMQQMLAEAASACQRQGRHLVLVVDGLDEDTGVTGGHDSYSIAALLPAGIPGLRVIVAGRPDPPLPIGVPTGHPLKNPQIVRSLARSEHAQIIRADAERGLQRLLGGTETERDLLSLVTAAGGGLSTTDLAELTDAAEHDIQRILYAVSGRTFASRLSSWRPDTAPQLYVFAHEDLQVTATQTIDQRTLSLNPPAKEGCFGRVNVKGAL